MSVSKVEICNMALQLLGDESIISLSDGTTQAEQCNFRYDSARRSVLEMHPWNFALKRASLPLSSTKPAFDFSHQFTLPSDLLRVIATDKELDVVYNSDPYFNGYKTIGFQTAFSSGRDRYKIEGRNLLYDDDVCNVLYLRDEEDTTLFSPLFVEALALFLASRIVYKITGSRTMEKEFLAEFDNYMARVARTVDAQQGTIERSDTSRMLSVRV